MNIQENKILILFLTICLSALCSNLERRGDIKSLPKVEDHAIPKGISSNLPNQGRVTSDKIEGAQNNMQNLKEIENNSKINYKFIIKDQNLLFLCQIIDLLTCFVPSKSNMMKHCFY
jgi:hypothetical protein